jgi:hypothetical protein
MNTRLASYKPTLLSASTNMVFCCPIKQKQNTFNPQQATAKHPSNTSVLNSLNTEHHPTSHHPSTSFKPTYHIIPTTMSSTAAAYAKPRRENEKNTMAALRVLIPAQCFDPDIDADSRNYTPQAKTMIAAADMIQDQARQIIQGGGGRAVPALAPAPAAPVAQKSTATQTPASYNTKNCLPP